MTASVPRGDSSRKPQPIIIYGENDSAERFVVPRHIAQDDKLSYAACGLLIFLHSHNGKWQFTIDELVRPDCDREQVLAVLEELEYAGYLDARAEEGGAE